MRKGFGAITILKLRWFDTRMFYIFTADEKWLDTHTHTHTHTFTLVPSYISYYISIVYSN